MAPPPKRALLSVSNKQDIKIIARGLVELGYEIISTSGTARLLNEHGIPVTDVSSVTGYPELMNGLVKTLHPIIHAGILANNDIEVVVVNLYPAETAMDIGGHAMLRAAVKNRSHVLTLVDPDDYNEALFNLADFTGLDETFMSDMAVKALQHTMKHDASILEMISSPTSLRYGENPHQTASINHVFQTSHGKSLSYCNYLDVDAALTCVAQFSAPTVAVVKHCSPCGLASGVTLRTAMLGALLGDPLSSFGSVVACNVPLTKKATEELVNSSKFIEVVVAPEIRQDVREILTTRPHWKKNVRLIESPPPSQWSTTTTRSTGKKKFQGVFFEF
jgi:phosphoribosylaminoimidazolecarboxamide formyltransferase / IMP cyclohydrolase